MMFRCMLRMRTISGVICGLIILNPYSSFYFPYLPCIYTALLIAVCKRTFSYQSCLKPSVTTPASEPVSNKHADVNIPTSFSTGRYNGHVKIYVACTSKSLQSSIHGDRKTMHRMLHQTIIEGIQRPS